MRAPAQGPGWAWHRLDDAWAARIVRESGVRPGELVLDIGAGQGVLTAHLVAAGARVIATLLRTLTARQSRLVRADLVLQKAFVRSVTATGPRPGRWHPRAGISLPRHAFHPKPRVDSCVLVLAPL